MIIDNTYFVGDILLPGLGTTPVQNSVQLFIEKREPEYLCAALGYGFYKSFKAALEAGNPAQKWIDLRDGADYTDSCGNLQPWEGLANDDKQSGIADYVYYWYMRNDVTYTTTVGEQEGKTDNATAASPAGKMARAWNSMVDHTRRMHDFLMNKRDDDGNLVYDDFKLSAAKCERKINVFGL